MGRTSTQPLTAEETQADKPLVRGGGAGIVCLATLVELREGTPWLSVAGIDDLITPVATVSSLESAQIGQVFAVAMAEGDYHRPIVLGAVHEIDRELVSRPLVLESNSEIRLQCGKATIKLSADGTVAIRGTNVASRASHTNRIRGGNVQIN